MSKKYTLKIDHDSNCFICHDKIGMSFDKEALQFIQSLSLCSHHQETIKSALEKVSRQPGEDDE